MSQIAQDEFFQINAVSRLTGLSTHNIRVWEKRYGVVEPERTDTGRRQYTREHIQRLSLLKSLVDAGHSIGTIANLRTDQLEQRFSEVLKVPTTNAVASSTARVTVIGGLVQELVGEISEDGSALDVVGAFPDLESANISGDHQATDLFIIECPTLFETTLQTVRKLLDEAGARRAILVYSFAPQATVDFVTTDIPGITAIRGPVNKEELSLACLADLRLARREAAHQRELPAIVEKRKTGKIPPRQYTNEQLVSLSRATPEIRCECPQHLVNLLFSLTAFETYSEECENRNEEDAKLHAWLHQMTAQARSIMEEALEGVVEAEGIEV